MENQITQNSKEPLKLLLIEDSVLDARLVKKVLCKHMQCDCLFLHATDMQHAETCLEKNADIDIILLDLGLPDTKGGEDTFDRIETIQTDVPVIVLTSKDNHDLAISIIDDGAEDYIRKSSIGSSPQRLCDAIDFAMCRHKHSEAVKHEKDALMQMVSGCYSVNSKCGH